MNNDQTKREHWSPEKLSTANMVTQLSLEDVGRVENMVLLILFVFSHLTWPLSYLWTGRRSIINHLPLDL